MTINNFMRTAPVFIVLIIAGCAGSRPSPDPINPIKSYEMDSVMDSIWSPTLPTTLKARADLSMKTPLYSGTMVAEISHRLADSLLIIFRLRGLGIEGGRLLVTRDSLFFYERFSKTLRVADSNHPALPALFSVQNALEKMLGYVRPLQSPSLQLAPTEEGLLITDPDLSRAYTIDPVHWRTIQMTQKDASGKIVEAFYFSNYFEIGDGYFPRQIIYRNPSMDMNAILNYSSLSVNEPISSMSLALPDEVTRVPLQEE